MGAAYHGKFAGSFGIGSFSLYATKNLNTGEGGVITTNDDAIADRLRLLRNQFDMTRNAFVLHRKVLAVLEYQQDEHSLNR